MPSKKRKRGERDILPSYDLERKGWTAPGESRLRSALSPGRGDEPSS